MLLNTINHKKYGANILSLTRIPTLQDDSFINIFIRINYNRGISYLNNSKTQLMVYINFKIRSLRKTNVKAYQLA